MRLLDISEAERLPKDVLRSNGCYWLSGGAGQTFFYVDENAEIQMEDIDNLAVETAGVRYICDCSERKEIGTRFTRKDIEFEVYAPGKAISTRNVSKCSWAEIEQQFIPEARKGAWVSHIMLSLVMISAAIIFTISVPIINIVVPCIVLFMCIASRPKPKHQYKRKREKGRKVVIDLTKDRNGNVVPWRDTLVSVIGLALICGMCVLIICTAEDTMLIIFSIVFMSIVFVCVILHLLGKDDKLEKVNETVQKADVALTVVIDETQMSEPERKAKGALDSMKKHYTVIAVVSFLVIGGIMFSPMPVRIKFTICPILMVLLGIYCMILKSGDIALKLKLLLDKFFKRR